MGAFGLPNHFMKKVKITILTPVRLDGIDREAGEVAELDESLINRWCELGYCEKFKEPDTAPVLDVDLDADVDPDQDPGPDKELESKLKPVGIGYYEMPDGSKVKGKAAALEALKTFKTGS